MALQTMEAARAQASALGTAAWVARHPQPVLVAREVIDGDLQFADPGTVPTESRPGGTMLHVPRVSARERLTGPRRSGRTAHSEERFVLLDRSITVGRDAACDLVLRDHTISTRHATIAPVPGTDRAMVTDHGSRNGTAHNGRRIADGQPSQLITGDEVCLGRQVFVFLSAADWHGYLTDAL
jgi:hypothetical protein